MKLSWSWFGCGPIFVHNYYNIGINCANNNWCSQSVIEHGNLSNPLLTIKAKDNKLTYRTHALLGAYRI